MLIKCCKARKLGRKSKVKTTIFPSWKFSVIEILDILPPTVLKPVDNRAFRHPEFGCQVHPLFRGNKVPLVVLALQGSILVKGNELTSRFSTYTQLVVLRILIFSHFRHHFICISIRMLLKLALKLYILIKCNFNFDMLVLIFIFEKNVQILVALIVLKNQNLKKKIL